MRSELKNKIISDYTIIPNKLISDNSISERARFLFCLLASKPDSWKFYNKELAKECSCSLDTLRKNTDELINKGWVIKQKQGIDKRHRFTGNMYILNANPTASEKNRHGNLPIRKKPIQYQETSLIRSNKKKEVNKKIAKEVISLFNEWWDLYDKKINKEECEKLFYGSKKLKNKKTIQPELIETILWHTKAYVENTPDKQYRKHPYTYLFQSCWNDEIVKDNQHKKLSKKEENLKALKELYEEGEYEEARIS